MIIENPSLFDEAELVLLPHLTHRITITPCGGDAAPETITLECDDCKTVLVDFQPGLESEKPDPAHVRYEGHYDEGRDVCWVEVFRPGKSPYPLQERQDLVNHSPTGIAWGYYGSGPAQLAFALLIDYFADEGKARTLYQDFKFRTIGRFEQNQPWVLTGAEIERAIGTFTLARPLA